jgi:DNA-binding winged helix-turn-helix (wHTH) protein/tetratricopeptide (TPR) repeat protein
MHGQEIYEFGEFVLDAGERRLARATAVIPLEPKTHDLLVALVRRAGTLVTKADLLDIVWPDTAVEEGILAVHVSTLRKVLGDRHAIGTVSRSGYRFTAAVRRRRSAREPLSMRWPVGVLPARPEVSELIGRGRSCLLSMARHEVPKAIEAFQSAIDMDGSYAAAHAGLALACCAQAELRLAPPSAAYEGARAAALRALAMDDACADAQVALGTVLFLSDWNWVGARRSLERALELDPSHRDAWLLYGRLLEALGDLDGGLAAKHKALEHDPSSAAVHLQIALSYWNQRRYDEMIEWANRSLALDPKHLLAREYIAGAYLMKGDVDRYMEENLAHASTYGCPPQMLEELAQIYAGGGRRAVVEHTLGQAGPSTPPMHLAMLLGELGRLDEAFAQLDRSIALHDPSLVHLAVAPQWDPMRGDPRFAARLRAMGLGAQRGAVT